MTLAEQPLKLAAYVTAGTGDDASNKVVTGAAVWWRCKAWDQPKGANLQAAWALAQIATIGRGLSLAMWMAAEMVD